MVVVWEEHHDSYLRPKLPDDFRLDTLYCLLRIGRIAAERKDGRWFVSAAAVAERMKLLGKSDNSPNPTGALAKLQKMNPMTKTSSSKTLRHPSSNPTDERNRRFELLNEAHKIRGGHCRECVDVFFAGTKFCTGRNCPNSPQRCEKLDFADSLAAIQRRDCFTASVGADTAAGLSISKGSAYCIRRKQPFAEAIPACTGYR